MGVAKLWWYPGGTAPLQELEFSEEVSDLADGPIRLGAMADDAQARIRRVNYGSYMGVRILVQDFTDAQLRRELRSLEGHLKAGHPVGFAFDDDKAWAGFCTSVPAPGDTTLNTSGHLFSAFSGLVQLSSGDEVVVLSAAPEAFREWLGISNHSVGTFTLSDAVRYAHSASPIFVREANFFPILRYAGPRDQPLVRSDTQWNSWTFDVTLREDTAAYAELEDTDGEELATTSDDLVDGGQGATLSQVLEYSRTRNRVD